MTFQPGQSGNPQGRAPKGQATAELLRAIADLPYGRTKQTHRERAARAIWRLACRGNLQAFAWIVERTEGKVPDHLEVDQRTELTISGDDIDGVLGSYALRRGAAIGPK